MFAEILAEIFKFAVKAGLKEWNTNSLKNISYDENTKIDILKEQFKKYFSIEDGQEKMDVETYINQIILDLKNDFSSDENKISLLEDILYEIKYNSDHKKSIQKILSKF